MAKLTLKVDADEVMRNLRAMDADLAKNLTKFEREILKPAWKEWKPLIPRGRSGQMAGSARMGVKGRHVWMGYGNNAPVYMGLQEFGGSVPVPHSRNAAARLGKLAQHGQLNLSKRAVKTGERRILVKRKAPSESWTLYPVFRRHESRLAERMNRHLAALLQRYGF